LLADKVIAPKEMFDKQIEHERLRSTISAATDQQIALWQQALVKYKLERSQFENMSRQLNEDTNQYLVRSAVGGVLQGFDKYHPGSFVQQGESPWGQSPRRPASFVECFMNTRDVGLLKINQSTVFQVDAFDHNYFGVLKGKIISIDNDYTLIMNRPAYKVCCMLESGQLHLKNGFKGVLKKGMTVRARYIVARRSLWQLAFDQVNDWVNPNEGNQSI
jgi:HlyD family secretion protein